MIIAILAIIVFIINIPFGYWRKSQKKFSFNWFLSIHIPVIVAILLRYLFDVEIDWLFRILFILIFAAGQFFGKFLYSYRLKIKYSVL